MIRQNGQDHRSTTSLRHARSAMRLMGEAGLLNRAAASDSRDWRDFRHTTKRSILRRTWIVFGIVAVAAIVMWFRIL